MSDLLSNEELQALIQQTQFSEERESVLTREETRDLIQSAYREWEEGNEREDFPNFAGLILERYGVLVSLDDGGNLVFSGSPSASFDPVETARAQLASEGFVTPELAQSAADEIDRRLTARARRLAEALGEHAGLVDEMQECLQVRSDLMAKCEELLATEDVYKEAVTPFETVVLEGEVEEVLPQELAPGEGETAGVEVVEMEEPEPPKGTVSMEMVAVEEPIGGVHSAMRDLELSMEGYESALDRVERAHDEYAELQTLPQMDEKGLEFRYKDVAVEDFRERFEEILAQWREQRVRLSTTRAAIEAQLAGLEVESEAVARRERESLEATLAKIDAALAALPEPKLPEAADEIAARPELWPRAVDHTWTDEPVVNPTGLQFAAWRFAPTTDVADIPSNNGGETTLWEEGSDWSEPVSYMPREADDSASFTQAIIEYVEAEREVKEAQEDVAAKRSSVTAAETELGTRTSTAESTLTAQQTAIEGADDTISELASQVADSLEDLTSARRNEEAQRSSVSDARADLDVAGERLRGAIADRNAAAVQVRGVQTQVAQRRNAVETAFDLRDEARDDAFDAFRDLNESLAELNRTLSGLAGVQSAVNGLQNRVASLERTVRGFTSEYGVEQLIAHNLKCRIGPFLPALGGLGRLANLGLTLSGLANQIGSLLRSITPGMLALFNLANLRRALVDCAKQVAQQVWTDNRRFIQDSGQELFSLGCDVAQKVGSLKDSDQLVSDTLESANLDEIRTQRQALFDRFRGIASGRNMPNAHQRSRLASQRQARVQQWRQTTQQPQGPGQASFATTQLNPTLEDPPT